MTYDLVVIGAGPGGCATAIAAARSGAQVLLLEAGRFPRQKVCGEFVSAESLGLLEVLLHESERALILSAPRIAGSRVFADGAEIPAEINPPAASIARFDLDSALWRSAQQSGVTALENCAVKSIERGPSASADDPQTFVVGVNEKSFEARALVNATGRWSFLSSAATRAKVPGSRWIGVKAHFYEADAPGSVDLYFFSGGYCGVQPVLAPKNGSGWLINACAMVQANVATDLAQVFCLHSALRHRSTSWTAAMQPVSTSPLIFHQPEPVRGDMLQVGDAATFVDPFIGDGISLALRSGNLAAQSLQSFFSGRSSLQEAVGHYGHEYRAKLAPVFRASSYLRNFFNLPEAVRRPVMSLLRYTPAITRRVVRMTR
jgi:menaquinone-9 beta-reductase